MTGPGTPLEPEPRAPGDPPPGPSDSVGRGAAWVLAGHVAAFAVGALLNRQDVRTGLLITFFALGVFQWAYVVPMLAVAYAKGRRQTAKGIWILAGVTVLPTCACVGTLVSMEL